ncbi:MAG: FHA domain-containing protein [Actinobacteria bacterium]|nr:FHA domain-containing protein [Actinomycetota bacterium]
MSTAGATYVPGCWLAIVGPNAAVLVADTLPADRLRPLWDVVRDGGPFGAMIDALTGGRLADLPSFGLAVVEPEGIRVVVRPALTVSVISPSGPAATIHSRSATTWVEEVVEHAYEIRLRTAAPNPASGTLPLTGGIAYAAEVAWRPASDVRPHDAPPPAAPAVPAAHPRRTQPEGGQQDGGQPDARRGAASAAGGARVDRTPAPVTGADATGPAYDDPVPATAPSPTRVPAGGGPAGGGPAGGLNGRAVTGPPVVATIGRGAVSSRPAAGPDGRVVQAVFCTDGHPNPPAAGRCRRCGGDLPQQSPVPVAAPALGVLRFSTGEPVTLDRTVIVGRAPSAQRISGTDLPRLCRVTGSSQDISRDHLEVRVEGWHVFVVDLGSRNGTTVTVPGQVAQRLSPLEPYRIDPGARVTLDEQVFFTYEV